MPHLHESSRVVSPTAVIASVLPIYLLMLAGGVCRKLEIVRKEHDAGIMQAVYMVMLPCLMLDKMLGSDSLSSISAVATAAAMGFGLIMIGLLIAYSTGRLFGLEKGNGLRTFTICSGTQNFGFTAAPVVEILWSTGTLAMLFVHNMGVELAVWSVGVLVISGSGGIRWRKLLNGPVFAVVIGLTMIFTGTDEYFTGPPRRALSMIGVGAFPLGVFITGATIMDFVGKERPSLRIISAAVLVRLCLAPFMILCAAKYLPLVKELREVLVVQAAMPAALTPIMLARMYGGSPGVAVQIAVSTTILSVITLPLIITWGCRWISLNPLLQ